MNVVASASAELSSWRASSEKTVQELQEAQAQLTQQLTQAHAQLNDAQAALSEARKAHVRLSLVTRPFSGLWDLDSSSAGAFLGPRSVDHSLPFVDL